MTKLTVAFRNFANVSKKSVCVCVCVCVCEWEGEILMYNREASTSFSAVKYYGRVFYNEILNCRK